MADSEETHGLPETLSRDVLIQYLDLDVFNDNEMQFLLDTSRSSPRLQEIPDTVNEFEHLVGLLPQILQDVVKDALNHEWPFLPSQVDDWLKSAIQLIPDLTNCAILTKSLLVALEHGQYPEAAAVAFVLDRFMYFQVGSKMVFQAINLLKKHSKETAISPQLQIRRARGLKHVGDIHGCHRVLNEIIDDDWRGKPTGDGCWSYKSEEQYMDVKEFCTIEKVWKKLGLWTNAPPSLLRGPKSKYFRLDFDESGNMLTNIVSTILFMRMHIDYRENWRSFTATILEAPSRWDPSLPESLFTARNMMECSEALMRYSNQFDIRQPERRDLLKKALYLLRKSLSQHESLSTPEQSHIMLKSIYLASLCLMSPSRDSDVQSALAIEKISLSLFTIFCKTRQGFGNNARSKTLIVKALDHLDVKCNGSLSQLLHETDPDKCLKIVDLITIKEMGPLKESGISRGGREQELVAYHGQYTTRSTMGYNEPKLYLKEGGEDAIVDAIVSNLEIAECFLQQAQRRLMSERRRLQRIFHFLEQALSVSEAVQNQDSSLTLKDNYERDLLKPIYKVDPTAETICFTIELGGNTNLGSLPLNQNTLSSCNGSSSRCSTAADLENIFPQDDVDSKPFIPSVNSRPAPYYTHFHPPDAKVFLKGTTEGAARACLWNYEPLCEEWSAQSTIVHIGDKVELRKEDEGAFRDAIHVDFLHQADLGRYVGKRYRGDALSFDKYLQDVKAQMTTWSYAADFNEWIQPLDLEEEYPVIKYLPAYHLQVFSSEGDIVDLMNIEPYMKSNSEFFKLTSNFDFRHKHVDGRVMDLGLAFTHFSHCISGGELMIVDLQGWLPLDNDGHLDTKGVLYLTDPQFHSVKGEKMTPFDLRERGMETFWKVVHPVCNKLCRRLELSRPDETK